MTDKELLNICVRKAKAGQAELAKWFNALSVHNQERLREIFGVIVNTNDGEE